MHHSPRYINVLFSVSCKHTSCNKSPMGGPRVLFTWSQINTAIFSDVLYKQNNFVNVNETGSFTWLHCESMEHLCQYLYDPTGQLLPPILARYHTVGSSLAQTCNAFFTAAMSATIPDLGSTYKICTRIRNNWQSLTFPRSVTSTAQTDRQTPIYQVVTGTTNLRSCVHGDWCTLQTAVYSLHRSEKDCINQMF